MPHYNEGEAEVTNNAWFDFELDFNSISVEAVGLLISMLIFNEEKSANN